MIRTEDSVVLMGMIDGLTATAAAVCFVMAILVLRVAWLLCRRLRVIKRVLRDEKEGRLDLDALDLPQGCSYEEFERRLMGAYGDEKGS